MQLLKQSVKLIPGVNHDLIRDAIDSEVYVFRVRGNKYVAEDLLSADIYVYILI